MNKQHKTTLHIMNRNTDLCYKATPDGVTWVQPSQATSYNTYEEAMDVMNILVALGFECCVRSFNPSIPWKFRMAHRS